ncbi:hypothetical protein TB2_019530 [Malus domestica]
MTLPEDGKSWILHMQMGRQLLALDIVKLMEWSKLHKSRRPPKPEFKLLHNEFYPDHDNDNEGSRTSTTRPRSLPWGMRYVMVDSKPYIVGGQFSLQPPSFPKPLWESPHIYNHPALDDIRPHFEALKKAYKAPPDWANLDVVSYGSGDSICKSNLPRMCGPKLQPFVATIDDKIYVLSTEYRGKDVQETSPALFEVFHPSLLLWKVLPNPPFIVDVKIEGVFMDCCYTWDKNLIVRDRMTGQHYQFDTSSEKWHEDCGIMRGMYARGGLAQYKDFLLFPQLGSVCSYRSGCGGLSFDSQEVDGLRKIFRPHINNCTSFITQFGEEDLMCIVCSGFDKLGFCCCRVAVFKVSIEGFPENPSIRADVVAEATYYFSDEVIPDEKIFQVFAMRDYANKLDDLVDASCLKEDLPGLDWALAAVKGRGRKRKGGGGAGEWNE